MALARRRSRENTAEPSPKAQSLASATASSSVLKRATAITLAHAEPHVGARKV